MAKSTQAPWAAGPGEILKHGLELLRKDTDTNRRLAMISIDNAVELMLKTYLGLPKRVSGLVIKRNEYQEFSESFPKLLDALEKYASDKLDGVELGDIEWYHRLRNQLYHQGNGLTVERDKVEVYAELANALFANLFGSRLVQPEDDGTMLLGNFMIAWVDFEKSLSNAVALVLEKEKSKGRVILTKGAELLAREGMLTKSELAEINELRVARNNIVHGMANHKDALRPNMVDKLTALTDEIDKRVKALDEGTN